MLNSIKVGFFLAYRYIKYSSPWKTILTVFIMMLTFINLVVISGILVGLVEGSKDSFRKQYAGDVLISTQPEEQYIQKSTEVIDIVKNMPEVEGITSRYIARGSIENNYRRYLNQPNTEADSAGAAIAGINPEKEARITNIDKLMAEGEFLDNSDQDKVVLGAFLVERYLPGSFGLETLEGVRPGDKIRVNVNGTQKEVTVKGILESKTDTVDQRVYFNEKVFRKMIQRSDYNVNEIAVKLKPGASAKETKQKIIDSGVDKYALVRTAEESLGQFFEDIKTTMSTLANVFGGVGLLVAAITIFIVIFITAITRQRYIGILKAIGVPGTTIQMSYILLSLFYSLIGVTLGVLFLYFVLVPYFQANPIDFPFSEGILAVTTEGTILRSTAIIVTTLISGYIPSKIIVRQKALESILGKQ